jgi:hypothetical protein
MGSFMLRTGQFDLSSPNISGSTVVAAGTGKNGNGTRDRKMSTDILNVPKFTEARFVPQHMNGSFASAGDSTVEIDGVFALHATPHDLTVPMQIHVDGKTATAKLT